MLQAGGAGRPFTSWLGWLKRISLAAAARPAQAASCSMDDADFEALLVRLNPTLIGIFTRRGFTPPEAEDLAQQVSLQAVRYKDSLTPDRNPEAYIKAIAYNLAKRAGVEKKNRSKREITTTDIGVAGSDDQCVIEFSTSDALWQVILQPDEEVARSDDWQVARSELAKLDAEDRTLLYLRHFEGMTVPGIATKLGIKNLSTAQLKVWRAHLKARALLKAVRSKSPTPFATR